MIFDLYKAHKIMRNPKYGIAVKLLRLHKLGLHYKEVHRFFIYIWNNIPTYHLKLLSQMVKNKLLHSVTVWERVPLEK